MTPNMPPVMSMTESIRMVGAEASRSMNRADFRTVQTPQVFRANEIIAAYHEFYDPRTETID